MKIGDKVEVTDAYGHAQPGMRGTVVIANFHDNDRVVGVRFNSYHRMFHDLGGVTPNGHGYWVEVALLRVIGDYSPGSLEYAIQDYVSKELQ